MAENDKFYSLVSCIVEIKPEIGIENIYLGMTMAEVRGVWGDPEEISTFIPLEEKPVERTIEWRYSNDVELSFDWEDEFLLTSIDCDSKLTTLDGLTLIGLTPKELKFRLPEIKLDDEYQSTIDEYRHENLELSFWVQNGKVYSVTINPKYDESGNEVIWPKRNN